MLAGFGLQAGGGGGDLLLLRRQLRAAPALASRATIGDHFQALHHAADVVPGATGLLLTHPGQQQGQPAQPPTWLRRWKAWRPSWSFRPKLWMPPAWARLVRGSQRLWANCEVAGHGAVARRPTRCARSRPAWPRRDAAVPSARRSSAGRPETHARRATSFAVQGVPRTAPGLQELASRPAARVGGPLSAVDGPLHHAPETGQRDDHQVSGQRQRLGGCCGGLRAGRLPSARATGATRLCGHRRERRFFHPGPAGTVSGRARRRL